MAERVFLLIICFGGGKMSTEIKWSIWAHIINSVLIIASGLFFTIRFYGGWTMFGWGAFGVWVIITICFLIFAVPFKRGWLTKKHILWRILTFTGESNANPNFCHLPGMILKILVSIFLYVVFVIFAFIVQNVLQILFMGKIVKLKKNSRGLLLSDFYYQKIILKINFQNFILEE